MIMGNVRVSATGHAASVTVRGFSATAHVDGPADADGRNVYGWSLAIMDGDDAHVLTSGRDDQVRSGVGAPVDALAALETLLSFAEHDGDAYRLTMGRGEPDDGFLFGATTAELLYVESDRVSEAAMYVADAQESSEYVL